MSNFKEGTSFVPPAPKLAISTRVRALLILLSLAAAVLVGLDIATPARVVLALGFMCLVPGAVLLSFSRATGPLTIAALSVAFSLALCAAIATISVWARSYEPQTMFVVTAVVCAVLLLIAPLFRMPADGIRYKR